MVIRQFTPAGTSAILFWIKASEWKKAPDLVFHECNKNGPVVGSAIMRRHDHEMTLRLGGNGTLDDHSAGGGLATMKQDKKHHDSAYTLAIPTASTSQQRLYRSHRTQSSKDGVQGLAAKLAYYNWTITNVRREKVGLYLENPRSGISLLRGKLRLNPDTLDQLDDVLSLLLGLMAIIERTQRTRRHLNLAPALNTIPASPTAGPRTVSKAPLEDTV
ncbi:hypothetical protein QFC20_001870 [Naganishia adeliensis]|uniref:Uncharacterized protein n=1 Tax=Naganishia adeliensis TaxID=92952 RepID=A0ACC2WQS2_9TREE|nr:hypothetical protein QFC20_001870 [Naganishia adeliensis]